MAQLKADVTVAGRSKEAGDKIVAAMKQANPEGSYDFQAVDVSLMSEVRKFSKKYMEEHKSLNYLVVSTGIMTMQGRTETKEGIDVKMALHYYARWFLINELMPALEASAGSNADTRVLTVLSAAEGKPVDMEDWDLKKHYSLSNAAAATTFYNDLMVQELSIRHPNVAFMHIYPGIVYTSLATRQSNPWYLRAAAMMTKPFTVSISECAEFMVSGLMDEKRGKGWWLLRNHGEEIKPTKFQTDEIRTKVWEHTDKLVQEALAKSAPSST